MSEALFVLLSFTNTFDMANSVILFKIDLLHIKLIFVSQDIQIKILEVIIRDK